MTFVYGCSLPAALVVSVLPVYAAAEEFVLPVTGHYLPPVYLYHLCIYKNTVFKTFTNGKIWLTTTG